MTQSVTPDDAAARRHPVLACVERIDTSLMEVAEVSPVFMSTAEKRAVLLELAGVEAQLAGLRLRVLAAADDVAVAAGARDVAALVAHHARDDASRQRRELRMARVLEARWHRVGQALGAGQLNLAQAGVVVRALGALTTGRGGQEAVDPEVLGLAEEHLVAQAAHYGPRELAVLGRKVLEVVAPEVCERHEARAVAAEERRAAESTSLTATRLGDGSTRIRILVPDGVAQRLRTCLEAFTSPRHRAGEVSGPREGDRIPAHRAAGQAFCALLEAVDPRRLPSHGGDATTLVVTVGLAQLRGELGVAQIPGAGRLSASQARRLACTATIVPAVLGGRSEPLDLGRGRRLFSPAQRKALAIRDQRCRAEGCDIPAAWCEAHHAGRPWAAGGTTDLKHGLLLCSFHHHRAHDPRYDHRRLPDGDLRFHRRT